MNHCYLNLFMKKNVIARIYQKAEADKMSQKVNKLFTKEIVNATNYTMTIQFNIVNINLNN